MAWEWVGAVATGAVGVAGIVATLASQRAARLHALDVMREARTQERGQAAYERILLTALKTTEFMEYADVIWDRESKPPDVDADNFDMWILTDLYTSTAFREAYARWLDALAQTRQIADAIPEGAKIWDQPGDLPKRYRASADGMRRGYEKMAGVAREELR